MRKTLNDKNWEKLFDKYSILNEIKDNGYFIITSSQINEFREARLMTKFDHISSLPKIFKKNNLGILPTKRGEYIISTFNAYQELQPIVDEPEIIYPKQDLISIDPKNIYSESIALNYAAINGIFEDFFNTSDIYFTINGRMGTESFEFYIEDRNNSYNKIKVENAQIEIDAGYETKENLYLFEAKNSIPSDFLIRQLYYPFRLWYDKIGNIKNIKSIFMTYTNDIWSLYEYKFQDPMIYNSLQIIKQKNYIITHESITLNDIKNIMENIKLIDEPYGIPYPQANSFYRVINLLEILNTNKYSKEELFLNFNTDSLDTRQVDYYLNSVKYLGLLEEYQSYYTLNEFGKNIMKMSYKNKYLEIIKCILNKTSFYKSFEYFLIYSKIPSIKKIVKFMMESNVYNINSLETYNRRASTVRSWISWIVDKIEVI